VVAVLAGRTLLLALRAEAPPARQTWLPAALVFAAGLGLYGAVAWRLIDTALFPGGDEPHYLVIAQSLWRDGDLAIENNHRRGDTLEYFNRPLEPHYLTRGTDGQIYSIHPIGLAVALAPVLAAGGYHGVVAVLVAISALAGLLAWRLARRVGGATAAAIAWLATAAGAPFVFNSFTVYPEVPAAVAALVAFGLATRLDTTPRARLAAACGAALAVLPWLSSKYAAMAGALGAIAAARLWFGGTPDEGGRGTRLHALGWLAAIPAVSLVLWLAFFKAIWGTWSPSAPYGRQRAMSLEYLAAGGPGLLFDQEYGIVAMGPGLILALGGLGWMLLAGGAARRLAAEIVLVVCALLVPVGAFHQWWGGMAAVGRPLVASMLLLAIPVAWLYERARAGQPMRTVCWVLVAGSLAMVVTLASAQQGLLLVGERDGSSRLFTWWSPSWALAAVAPSFVAQPPGLAAVEAGLWIAALAAGLGALARLPRVGEPGRAALVAFVTVTIVLAMVTIAVPRVPGREELHEQDISERAESRLLHDFDARRRPIGIVYSPLRFVGPQQVASMVQFSAGPDAREERTPVPLLHRARWSLPAGRYRVELFLPDGVRRLTGRLGLQLGRIGEPIETWEIDAVGRWATTFDLPVDVRFVGLRASDDLAALRPRVRLRPIRITNAGERLGGEDVLQVRRMGARTVFYHDDASYPEPAGTWLRADSTTRISMAGGDGRSTRLRLRAGAGATTLHIRADGRRDSFALQAGEGRELTLAASDRPQHIEIATQGGFVPADVSPGSRDQRRLACWLEIAEP
jgi:hypothetical protein